MYSNRNTGYSGPSSQVSRPLHANRRRPPPARRYAHLAIHPYPAELATTCALRDGTQITLRPIRPEDAPMERAFVFTLSDDSKDFLLTEGTDMKYGARHLKRAIERLLVQPMSNLIATEQVRGGDWIRVDFDSDARALRFTRGAEGLPVGEMARMVDTSITIPALTLSQGAIADAARAQSARNSRRA